MGEGSRSHGAGFATGHDGSYFEYDTKLTGEEFDNLLLWAAERKASDITIQSGEQVFADIGGQLVRITRRPISPPDVEALVSHIYGPNGPAEIKSGHDLDPAHEVRKPDRGRLRFRVNITGGRMSGGDAIQITIRTLPEMPPNIDDLGIEEEIKENFRPRDGMVLVTGPTGSGKSTLLSAGIRMIVERPDANEKVLEYSKPVEYVYDKVSHPSSSIFQTDVGRHLRPKFGSGDEESEFAYCVRNALRRKPTIIMIGEARDKATIEASIEASLTGHVLYTTMHTIGVPETLRRAVMPFPGEERGSIAVDIMESLRMIVTQVLIPRVGGGKVGCREYMVFDPDTRAKMLEYPIDDWPKIIRRLLSEGKVKGCSMTDSARELYKQGLIDATTMSRFEARVKHEARAIER